MQITADMPGTAVTKFNSSVECLQVGVSPATTQQKAGNQEQVQATAELQGRQHQQELDYNKVNSSNKDKEFSVIS
jgi:hypothetical protein